MRISAISHLSRTAITLTAAGFFSLLSLQAQTARNATDAAESTAVGSSTSSSATSSTNSSATTVGSIPTSTVASWHETVVPEDKKITAKVTNGELIVDGLVAKVQLNYDIHHAGYLYIFVPGVGTAVVSRVEMYGSAKVPNALRGSTLAFSTGGHDFELTSESPLVSGKEDIYVRLDTAALSLDRMPMIGFGSTTRAPYAWPLSGPAAKDSQAHFVQPPPMPASMLPRTVATPSAPTTTSSNQDK